MFKFFRSILALSIILVAAVFAQAQFSADSNEPGFRKEPLPQNIKESLAKRRIEEEKKEHDELVEKGEKILKISEKLQKSFAQNNQLTLQDRDNLKDLEKIIKKIRKDLGGEGDFVETEDENAPTSTSNALENLKNTSSDLFDEIKKTSRLTISAVAIKTSNNVLNIVKFLKLKS